MFLLVEGVLNTNNGEVISWISDLIFCCVIYIDAITLTPAHKTMSDLQEERKQIESYMKDNNLEDMLNDCINELVRERPEDPFLDLSQTFESKSKLNAKIIAARAREVLSATGEPAFEAEIETIRGTFRCIVSDMGSYDEDENRYRGKGLLKAVEFTTTLLADKLLGKNPINQSEIDGILGGDANSPKVSE